MSDNSNQKKDNVLEIIYWGSFIWNVALCGLIGYLIGGSNLKTWIKWILIISSCGFVISMSILVGYIVNNKKNVDTLFNNTKLDSDFTDAINDCVDSNTDDIKDIFEILKKVNKTFDSSLKEFDDIKERITNLENRIKN